MNPIIKLFQELVYKGLERFGRYYSSYRAFVVDNEDPESMGRLRLIVPGIADNPMEKWAWAKGQFSGKGFGCQVLPPRGETVWVSFESGDPNFPIWEHGHFGESEIPEKLRSAQIFWFKSPKGFLVEMDDDKEEIRLTDIFGNQIVSNEQGISLGLEGKSKIFLGDINKGDQPGVLGNNLENIIAVQNKGILGAMKNVANIGKNFAQLATKMAAAGTPAGLMISLGSEVPGILKSVKDSSEEMDQSNKSINDLTKKIPGIKSSKVLINE